MTTVALCSNAMVAVLRVGGPVGGTWGPTKADAMLWLHSGAIEKWVICEIWGWGAIDIWTLYNCLLFKWDLSEKTLWVASVVITLKVQYYRPLTQTLTSLLWRLKTFIMDAMIPLFTEREEYEHLHYSSYWPTFLIWAACFSKKDLSTVQTQIEQFVRNILMRLVTVSWFLYQAVTSGLNLHSDFKSEFNYIHKLCAYTADTLTLCWCIWFEVRLNSVKCTFAMFLSGTRHFIPSGPFVHFVHYPIIYSWFFFLIHPSRWKNLILILSISCRPLKCNGHLQTWRIKQRTYKTRQLTYEVEHSFHN